MDTRAESIEAEVFLQELHDALLHLRDLPLRRGHPLCRRLGRQESLSPAALPPLLLDAVERLRPPPAVAPDAPRWRRYRYLTLRYVEGARLEQVVAELGISERQARREHRAALQELAALLLQQVGGPREAACGASGPTRGEAALADRALSSELEAELTALEANPDSEEIHLAGAIEDALGLAAPLAAARGVVVDFVGGGTSPRVIATPTVVRQIFLNVLSHVLGAPAADSVRVAITGGLGTATVHVVPARAAETADSAAGPTPALLAAQRLADGQQAKVATVGPEGAAIEVRFLTTAATLVLLVDDNPGLVRLFRRYLEGDDVRLIQARNGIQARQLARALRPDVLLLDLMMPVQDGWDLFRALRADPVTATIPVIACSVLPERDLALSLGADGFLAKPVTAPDLLAGLQPYRR